MAQDVGHLFEARAMVEHLVAELVAIGAVGLAGQSVSTIFNSIASSLTAAS